VASIARSGRRLHVMLPRRGRGILRHSRALGPGRSVGEPGSPAECSTAPAPRAGFSRAMGPSRS